MMSVSVVLAVCLCVALAASPQPLQNVAGVSRASVRVTSGEACAQGQTFVYPGAHPTEFSCLSACPRGLAGSELDDRVALASDVLLAGASCVERHECEAEAEVTLDRKHTFSLWLKPLENQHPLVHKYILRCGKLTLSATQTAVTVKYAGLQQGSYQLNPDHWNHFVLAVEYESTFVHFYAYVNGDHVGSSGEVLEEGEPDMTQPLTATIGDCGTGACAEDAEETEELMVKDFYVYNTVLSSSQVSTVYDETPSTLLPEPSCACPESNPISSGNLTCTSPHKLPLATSRFHSGDAFYFSPQFMLYPAGSADSFKDSDTNLPLFFASSPGQDSLTFTLDIAYTEIQTVTLHSRTKYPSEGIYISAYNRYSVSAETPAARMVLVPPGGCNATADDTFTCVELSDTKEDMYAYTADMTSAPPSVTSLEFHYAGLTAWEWPEFEPLDVQKSHIITNIVVMGRSLPHVADVMPLYGPVAGGTQLSITGEQLDLSDPTVMVGTQPCVLTSRSPDEIVCTTAAMDSTSHSVGDDLAISLSFSAGETFDNLGVFQYKDNPTVSKIDRLETFAAAGLSLTVTGTGFSGVAQPYLTTTALYGNQSYPQERTKCLHVTDEKITCPYPELDAGGTPVKDWDDVMYSLGLEFDGFQDYSDLSYILPEYSTAQVHPNPQIHAFHKTPAKYSVWKDTSISIAGLRLLSGCQQSDYSVVIGQAECVISVMDASMIKCTPPDDAPAVSREYDVWHDLPQVVVLVGARSLQVGWLLYESSVWDDISSRVMILAVIFGAFMVISVIILTLVQGKSDRAAQRQFEIDLLASLTPEQADKMDRLAVNHKNIRSLNMIARADVAKLSSGMFYSGSNQTPVIIKKMMYAQFATSAYHLRQAQDFLRGPLSVSTLEDASVQKLLAVSVFPQGVCAAYELARYPQLKMYLRSAVRLTVGELLRMCSELSAAMCYLSTKQVVHGDLGTRCCMLTKDGSCMLSDNALTRSLYPDEYAQVRGFSKSVPIRWMAPEYLAGTAPTLMSDVWSFGTLCWEILTRGHWPYEPLLLDQTVDKILKGKHPEVPTHVPHEVHNLLLMLWRMDPRSRPDFRFVNHYLYQCVTKAQMVAKRSPPVADEQICNVQILNEDIYQRSVAAPPSNYDDIFTDAGVSNLAFSSAADDESTRV